MSLPNNESNLQPTINIDQSIYEGNTTQMAPLGTRLKLGDRVFYYAQASASLAGATVVCAAPAVTSAQSGIFLVAATSAGAKIISATSSAAVTADFYAEGYVGEAAGAGIGEQYRIRSNAAGSTGFNITLYDGLATTITSGTTYWLRQNPFKNVFVGSQALHMALGVVPTAVTSGAYFWLQTWGPANPFHVAATPANGVLVLGTTGGVAVTADATTGAGISAVAYQIGKNSNLAATAGQANPAFIAIIP